MKNLLLISSILGNLLLLKINKDLNEGIVRYKAVEDYYASQAPYKVERK